MSPISSVGSEVRNICALLCPNAGPPPWSGTVWGEPAGPETLSGDVEDLGTALHQLQNTVMVLDHPIPARQRIDDWIDVILKEPLDALRIPARRADEAELVEQRIRNQARGAIEVALLPRDLDLPRVSAQAADVCDVEIVAGGAVEGDSTPGRENGSVVIRVDACHQQGGNLKVARIPAG